LKCLFSTPVWLILTCLRRAAFSVSLSHLLFIGECGKIKNVAMPIKAVARPMKTNMAYHDLKCVFVTCRNTKDTNPPMICPNPRPEYQTANLGACSDLV
jgi:hypothetical protein